MIGMRSVVMGADAMRVDSDHPAGPNHYVVTRAYQPSIGEQAFCERRQVGDVDRVDRAADGRGYEVWIRLLPDAEVTGDIQLLGEGTPDGRKTDLTLYTYALAVLQFDRLPVVLQTQAAAYARLSVSDEATTADRTESFRRLRRLMGDGL